MDDQEEQGFDVVPIFDEGIKVIYASDQEKDWNECLKGIGIGSGSLMLLGFFPVLSVFWCMLIGSIGGGFLYALIRANAGLDKAANFNTAKTIQGIIAAATARKQKPIEEEEEDDVNL